MTPGKRPKSKLLASIQNLANYNVRKRQQSMQLAALAFMVIAGTGGVCNKIAVCLEFHV